MDRKDISLLYMEDDPGLSRLIKRRLERRGYKVDLASDGETGLAMAAAADYDLLLVDYNMPGYGGLEVICHMNLKGKKVPSIMLTACGNERVAVEAMKLGAADYIVKDTGMGFLELLPMTIDRVLHRQKLANERQEMLDKLRENEEQYRGLVELSPNGIAVQQGGRLLFINPAGTRILGLENDSVLSDMSILSFIHPDDRTELANALEGAEKEGSFLPWSEKRGIRQDGKEICLEIAGMPLKYQGRKSVQIILRDVTDRKIAEQRLEYLALFDSLTGLGNRARFFDHLKLAIAQARRYERILGLLFLDLDGFKSVNDTLGHEAGDILLKEIGSRLQACGRESDSVARMGGDEFTFILTQIASENDAFLVAKRVQEVLTQPVLINNAEISVGVSIGVSVYPTDGAEIDELLRKADADMYQSKARSKGSGQISSNMEKTGRQSTPEITDRI